MVRLSSLGLAAARLAWRRFAWRLAASFGLTLLAIVAFAIAFAVGYARVNEGRVLPGIDVAGVPLAGLDWRAAEAELRRMLPDLGAGSLAVRIDGRESVIPYAQVERDYDIQQMLDRAFTIGRSGAPFDDLQQQMRTLVNGMSIEPAVTWDEQLLAERVTAIARADEITVVDASIGRPGGRYVVDPSVDGRAVDEQAAVALAAAAIDNLASADVTIEVQSETITPAVSTAQTQAAADRANRVAADRLSLTVNGTTTTIDASTINGWVHLDEGDRGEWALIIEPGPIAQLVDQLKTQVDVPATNAGFTFDAGEAVVVPDADGQEIDREAAVSAILAALEQRAEGSSAATVDLPVVSVAPEFTTRDAQQIVSRVELLSSWTTLYTPSALNGFGVNITRPTELIDGTVVGSGETFDFVEIAGPITEENGYTEGAAIINGNTKLDGVLGGGLCSTSTTIFNAALRAGFEINARRAHYYYIDRYPVGLDATIWITSRRVQTVAFTNDSPYPILIRGIANDRKVTFEIWGVPDGRRVSFSEPEVWDEQESWTEIEYADDLPAGENERVEYAFDGFKSLVTRTVTAADGAVLHDDTFRSNYGRVIGYVRVGRSPDDPPAGTIVRPDPLPE